RKSARVQIPRLRCLHRTERSVNSCAPTWSAWEAVIRRSSFWGELAGPRPLSPTAQHSCSLDLGGTAAEDTTGEDPYDQHEMAAAHGGRGAWRVVRHRAAAVAGVQGELSVVGTIDLGAGDEAATRAEAHHAQGA